MILTYLLCRGPWGRYQLRRYRKTVALANGLEAGLTDLSDARLAEKLADLKTNAQGVGKLDKLLPQALALGREISRRRLNMRHYDVQLLGTLALFEGYIAEMETGEGKTLIAPLTAFLHHLGRVDRCTHIVTANEYLAQRDVKWMGPLYKGLGLPLGVIVPGQSIGERIQAYQCSVVYATAREVVFDSIREPLRRKQTGTVDAILRPQREMELDPTYDFAIIDEVDSVLIDQARSPLSIGGSSSVSPQLELYHRAEQIAGQLVRGKHFRIMQDERTIQLKDEGKAEARRQAGPVLRLLPSGHRWERYVTCALAAKTIYKCDIHYVMSDQKIVLIDESTGRLMPGRQLPDGIHQALEMHCGLKPSMELRGAMTTTFQTFFRKYQKLAGMTGTARIAAREFHSVYDLPIVRIPPNKTLHRTVWPDRIYRSRKRKHEAVIEEIVKTHATGRPVLIGTGSVLESERISQLLDEQGLGHEVLNAKNHAREADIIAQAGQEGRITIITNMAGRGVDILLGKGVAEMGGISLIGTDRSAYRRLDEQLSGRIGRQGDPGECRFYLSIQDELLSDADRKKKCRLRLGTRNHRQEVLGDRAASKLFHRTQHHNDRVMAKARRQLYQSDKHREKLKEQGLWEDWMDAR